MCFVHKFYSKVETRKAAHFLTFAFLMNFWYDYIYSIYLQLLTVQSIQSKLKSFIKLLKSQYVVKKIGLLQILLAFEFGGDQGVSLCHRR